ncbi:MAG TPA: acyltransferase [Anaerolineales bacterium]|nr:acyltransferase [Anaerolineales bacterium]
MKEFVLTPSATGARISEIDGLRGIAILSVVIFHLVVFPFSSFLAGLGIRPIFDLLASGVDLFFVISGFLIGSILINLDGISGIRAFYIRRILRIWPLYYLLLFIVYVAVPDKSLFSKAPIWSFPLFIFNFWESMGRGIHQALGPLWSIAVEEQFYFLGPLLFLLLKRKQIVILLATWVVSAPFLRMFLFQTTEIDLWCFTPTRLDGVWVGLLIAIFFSDNNNILWVKKYLPSLQIVTFLLLIILIPSIQWMPDLLWASIGQSLVVLAFGCLLMVVQIRNAQGLRMHILNWGWLRYLGVRCYSIYLFHTFFAFIAMAVDINFYIQILLEIFLILTFSHISWRYLESPLIQLGRRFSYTDSIY